MSLRFLATAILCLIAGAAAGAPANLGRGLRPLVEEYRVLLESGKTEPDSFRAAVETLREINADQTERLQPA